MNDEWTYQDDDFNEDLPYIELQFGIDDLRLLKINFCKSLEPNELS